MRGPLGIAATLLLVATPLQARGDEHPSELETDRLPAVQTGGDCIVRGATVARLGWCLVVIVSPPFMFSIPIRRTIARASAGGRQLPLHNMISTFLPCGRSSRSI